MKFKVNVCRVGYSHGFIIVDIPINAIPRNKNGIIRQRMFEKMIEDKAIDQAGGESFFENESDYSVESVILMEKQE